MGTRHLTCAVIDGNYRVAQYGQWDGYPEGQGADVMKFLADVDRESFANKLRACSFYTDEELKAISDANPNWPKTHPELSRDAGAKVLGMIEANGGMKLKNSLSFAGDSLFCEWAYVVDFDKRTFEVYKGFNNTPLAEGERFYGFKSDGDYHPVAHVKTYTLAELPAEKTFLEQCDPAEVED